MKMLMVSMLVICALLIGCANSYMAAEGGIPYDSYSQESPDPYLPENLQAYSYELQQNGVWIYDTEYGYVWSPSGIAQEWTPYSNGYWSMLSERTWIPYEVWGWAPFHYGRWIFGP